MLGEAEDVYMSSSSNTVSEDEDGNNLSQLDVDEQDDDESDVEEDYDENL